MDYTEYSDLFTNLDSRESIFIWMVILVSFLLGFIIAYLLRTARVRAVKRELREAVEKQQAAEAQLATFQTQLEARNAELQAESREKVDLMDRVNQLELEKKNHYNEVYELNQRIEALESTNQSYSATIDDLNSQLVSLKAQGDQASTTPLGATAPAMEKESQDALQNRLAELEAQMTRLLTENDRLRISLADVQKNQTAAPTVDGLTDGNLRGIDQQLVQDKMAMFEAKLTQLENENDRLRADLTALQSTGGPVIDLSGGSSSSEQEEPALKIVSDKTVLGEKIILDDQPKDDLTKIEGLGPFLEGKLNEIGVFTYEEIASWTPAREEEVTLLIGHLPGRIAKDQWVAQAAQLAAAKEASSTVERQAASIMPEGEMPFGAIQQTPTDLKLIEGIGPKIEEILKANEIHNWSELAGTDPGRLREILEAAGDQYRMHNPYTWPLQARLAAAGRWEELKEYQEELKGGREVTD